MAEKVTSITPPPDQPNTYSDVSVLLPKHPWAADAGWELHTLWKRLAGATQPTDAAR